ncbi:MAG: hypothetical protein OEN01_16670 [Candidatus Krumholzibacteria bacterium]|nr:hypothetical protein [Candidatus Krumholzibacteria bacterium]
MNFSGQIVTSFFNLILMPFGTAHHTLGLVALSLLTGVAMAFVFKWTSNDRAIRAAKDKLKARILEMRIYQDDPVLILKGFGGTLKSNLVYLGTLILPVLVLLVPVVIVFMQMDERYSRRPLGDDAKTILSVELRDGVDPYQTEVALVTGSGVVMDSKPVRIAETGEIDWRLRVDEPGTHDITLSANGANYSFPVVAEKNYRMIGHERNASSWIEPLLHPGMPAISDDMPLARVRVGYPGARYPLLGWDVHWIVIFLVYSLLAAIVLKFIIKFEI